MMGYLDRLRKLDSGNCAPCVLPKLPKPPFGSNGSSYVTRFQKTAPGNDAVVGADAPTPMTPADARIGKVLAKLQADPGLRFAVEAHIDADPDAVILTLAIRDKAACELRIPREKYDPFLLLELIQSHSGKVH
jgi:hypothetical protein